MAGKSDSSVWEGAGTAAIGAGASIITDLFNKRSARHAQERQFAHDIDMFNRANEWNSYSNQKKLMLEAGLNPDLMYDKSASAESAPPPKFPDSSGLPLFGNPLQAALLGAQTRKANAEADKTEHEVPWVDRFNDVQIRYMSNMAYKVGEEYDQLSLMREFNLGIVQNNLKLSEAEAKQAELTLEKVEQMLQQKLDELIALATMAKDRAKALPGQLQQQHDQNEATIKLTNEAAETEKAKQENLHSSSVDNYASANLKNEQAKTEKELRRPRVCNLNLTNKKLDFEIEGTKYSIDLTKTQIDLNKLKTEIGGIELLFKRSTWKSDASYKNFMNRYGKFKAVLEGVTITSDLWTKHLGIPGVAAEDIVKILPFK